MSGINYYIYNIVIFTGFKYPGLKMKEQIEKNATRGKA